MHLIIGPLLVHHHASSLLLIGRGENDYDQYTNYSSRIHQSFIRSYHSSATDALNNITHLHAPHACTALSWKQWAAHLRVTLPNSIAGPRPLSQRHMVQRGRVHDGACCGPRKGLGRLVTKCEELQGNMPHSTSQPLPYSGT